ncbi:MAG: Bifunctional NAD(P)H-hydrate repair enzyme Nnr [Pseudomonadales bacterium]|nr:Bifunctional NAD(P)H-hydrate repair enzyme Nnr [Pseudomonadales bacterium]
MTAVPAHPPALYTAAEVRALDRAAIDGHGIPGIVLMARAGRALFEVLRAHFPGPQPLYVVCGTGNNGGDGFVVARLAADAGWPVEVALVGAGERIAGDARLAFEAAREAGVPIRPFDPACRPGRGVIVDALLGTGLGGAVRAAHAEAIGAINASALPVVAVDIPSGLCSDTGNVLGAAVRATHTVTFIGRKRGQFTGRGRALCGELHFADLGVPAAVCDAVGARAALLALTPLPPRARGAHKGHFGHVLIVGGNTGMGGAAAMAAEAAARCGAGLVSLATAPANVAAIVARRPEIMAHGVEHPHQLEPLLARASVLVIGPGLGRGAWAEQMLQRALASGKPAVLDADALNALADGLPVNEAARDTWLLTPHPGEAARLLGSSTAAVEADRFAALAALLERYPGAVVLKGAGTLVADATSAVTGVCPFGNPGMASGGMGDVLSGVLGALLAQGLPPGEAARLGVCLHACAADRAVADDGERGLLATDLLPWLRRLLNGRAPADAAP